MNILAEGLAVLVGGSLLFICIVQTIMSGNIYKLLFGLLVLYIVWYGMREGEVRVN